MTAQGKQQDLTLSSFDGGSRWPWAVFTAVGAVVGVVVVLGRFLPLLGLAGLAFLGAAAVLWLFFHPRIALVALVLFVPTQFWLVDELALLPGPMRFLDDLLFAILAGRVLIDRLRQGRPFTATPWDLPIAVFIGAGVLSALVNHVPFANAAAGIRAPLLYALLFYIVVNARDTFDAPYMDWIWRFLLVFALLQPLAAVYQYPLRGFRADSLTGTLGPAGANDLGVFLLPFLFYLVSLRFDSKRSPRLALAGIAVMVVTMILCGSRAAWFVSLAAVALLWGRRFFHVRTLAITVVACAILYGILNQVLSLQDVGSLERAVGWKTIWGTLFLVSSGGGNLAYFPVVWRLLQTEAVAPVLGLGPGMVSSTAAVHLNAPLYTNKLYDYFGQTIIGLDGSVESQILATGGEIGVAGLAAGYVIILLWLREARRARREGFSDHERALATGVFAAALAAIIITPIRNVWEIPHLSFSLWLPGAMLYTRRRSRG